MTKKVLVVTENKSLLQFIQVTSLTLTKLNAQVEINSAEELHQAEKMAEDDNLDLILLDVSGVKFNAVEFIKSVRENEKSKKKKIVAINRQEEQWQGIYDSGCDSIMTVEELRKSLNNILRY